MKKIEAVIKPFKLEDVKEALTGLGIMGITTFEVKGFGRQQGHSEMYRGAEYDVEFHPKVYVEVVVNDDQLESALSTIKEAAKTGKTGDGKIFVEDVERVVRIRTGETGSEAV